MTEVNTINKKGVVDQLYAAGIVHKTEPNQYITLWAASNAQAKQRAIEHFRPKKKELTYLWVILKKEYDAV